jgi:alpha-galactosidase
VLYRICWHTVRFALTTLALACCTLLLGAAPPAAQTDFTGVWAADVSTGDGNLIRTYFDLRQSGNEITGDVWYDINRRPITRGSVTNGKLRLEFILWKGNPPNLGAAEGLCQGDKIRIVVHLPDNVVGTGVAERTTRQALDPPAPLPLPALHDVPDNGLARTPPMGWNSWNKFKSKVDDATVRALADAMVSNGMKAAGYTYVNIDDTWEGPRDAQGNITGNLKFPDMKGLADYVHSGGLKIGLYSSPGPNTCDGYVGSFGHEEQDAKTYAAWGIDYVKYDWCSAGRIYKDSEMRAIYQKMGDALQATGHPIVFSLCQYGEDSSWKWGAVVGGNLWRTTGDINDTWKRMTEIGFSQFDIASYARPGHWNDPDMLEVGNGGMTPDEYRVHMSLWSLLAAPLLAGNDLRTMDDTAKSILINTEVIAIDQDPLALPVKKVSEQGDLVIAARPLKDKTWAVGLFNRGDAPKTMTVHWSDLGLRGALYVRNLWAHKDLGEITNEFSTQVPRHGVVLITVKP